MQIHGEPDNAFSWNYFLSGDGHQAYWDKKWSGEQCSVLIDGVLHEIRKHGAGSGQWSLERDGKVIASARKVSMWRRSFVVSTSSGMLRLMSHGMFDRSFFVGRGKKVIGSILPVGVFSRKVDMDIDDPDVDFPLAVFLFWLVILIWRRSQGS